MPAEAQDAEQYDVSGKWLLPGIIDAHIHICYNGSEKHESTFALLEKQRDELVLEAVDICKRVLSHGTTTIRDVGGEKYIEMSATVRNAAGEVYRNVAAQCHQSRIH